MEINDKNVRTAIILCGGRGLRLGDNKVNATLYDIADDLQYKSKENFTLKHFQERINIYTEEEFDYEIHNINLKD